MKRILVSSVLVFSLPCILGMGVLGEKAPRATAPVTAKEFTALITDVEGVSTEVNRVSYDGQLYVPVYRGKALVVIPFEKILSIDLAEEKVSSRRKAVITFTSKGTEGFLIDENLLFVGVVPFGTYQIEVRNMRHLEFVHPPSPR